MAARLSGYGRAFARESQGRAVQVKLGLEKGNGAVSESELWEAYCQAVEDLGDGESAHR